MVKKYVSRWHDGRRNMSLRTQTSTVIVSEQMSLHSTARDEVQPKTRTGVLRQVDNPDPRKEGTEGPSLVDRGYVNGFGAEQSTKSLLKDQLKDQEGKEHHSVGCGDSGFRQYVLGVEEEFDYQKCPQGKTEEDDDEQDIIKEDLV